MSARQQLAVILMDHSDKIPEGTYKAILDEMMHISPQTDPPAAQDLQREGEEKSRKIIELEDYIDVLHETTAQGVSLLNEKLAELELYKWQSNEYLGNVHQLENQLIALKHQNMHHFNTNRQLKSLILSLYSGKLKGRHTLRQVNLSTHPTGVYLCDDEEDDIYKSVVLMFQHAEQEYKKTEAIRKRRKHVMFKLLKRTIEQYKMACRSQQFSILEEIDEEMKYPKQVTAFQFYRRNRIELQPADDILMDWKQMERHERLAWKNRSLGFYKIVHVPGSSGYTQDTQMYNVPGDALDVARAIGSHHHRVSMELDEMDENHANLVPEWEEKMDELNAIVNHVDKLKAALNKIKNEQKCLTQLNITLKNFYTPEFALSSLPADLRSTIMELFNSAYPFAG